MLLEHTDFAGKMQCSWQNQCKWNGVMHSEQVEIRGTCHLKPNSILNVFQDLGGVGMDYDVTYDYIW